MFESASNHLQERMSKAIHIALETGKMLLNAHLESHLVSEKGPNDVVTEFDRAAERMIVHFLNECFPLDGFFGEETGLSGGSDIGGRWIIDPIDGTVNFTRGIPNYTISIAYEEKVGVPILGLVYNPRQNEMFCAILECGAFLNGVRITTSQIEIPGEVISLISPPHRIHSLAHDYFLLLEKIFLQTRDIRNFGSAALHLCYVACARADGFFEYGLHYYDIAAGMIILSEAGGVYEAFSKDRKIPECGDIVASNGPMQSWYTTQIRSSLSAVCS